MVVLGAVARYAISLIPVKTGFPVLTLITNIMGAVLIGYAVGSIYVILSCGCCILGILCGKKIASVIKF